MTAPHSPKRQTFDALRKYKEGKLWKQLSEIEPGEIELGLVELPEELPMEPGLPPDSLYLSQT